jgi:hypothetical protein
VRSSVLHLQIEWNAAGLGQPVTYIDEIDEHRWSLRCIRLFADGSQQAFTNSSYNWRNLMPEAAIPPLAEINADPQFKARRISKKQFEALWAQTYGFNQFSMMEPLLDVLLEFRPQWDAFVAGWKDNQHHKSKDGLPLYLVLAKLAGFLVHMLETNRTEKFGAIFEIIEHWLSQGDAYVKNATGAGLLEDLQNPVLYTNRNQDDFKPWLQSATLKCWERLKRQ